VNTFLAAEVPKVLADPDAMKRVVANLVDNAAEAMSASLVKEIDISTSPVEGRESVEITVADSGPGVTPELRERLFLPYFSTKNRGTGLGLAIVSKIVQEHRGSVRVEENSPAGARFIVEIPTATADAVQANRNGAAS
jgi:signal transduction histidine kinase